MTVRELIDKLQALPADLPVYLSDWNELSEPDHELDQSMAPTVVAERTILRRGGVTRHLPLRVVIGGGW